MGTAVGGSITARRISRGSHRWPDRAPADRRHRHAGRRGRRCGRPIRVAAMSTATVLLGWVVAVPVDPPETPAAVTDLAGHVTAISSAPSPARAASRQATPTATPTPDEVAIPATGTGNFAVASGDGAVLAMAISCATRSRSRTGCRSTHSRLRASSMPPWPTRAAGSRPGNTPSNAQAQGAKCGCSSRHLPPPTSCAPRWTRGSLLPERGTRRDQCQALAPRRPGLQNRRGRVSALRHQPRDGPRHRLRPHWLPRPGRDRPVMLQQSYGLDGCTANPWPYP